MWSGSLLYNREREDGMRERLTEGPRKAGAVDPGLTATSRRPQ